MPSRPVLRSLAIVASKISEFFEVTQHPTAEWLARQITILDLAAGDIDHKLGELGGITGALGAAFRHIV